jgi:lipopolysaccharide biosynthesis glycosyltransferase
VSTLPAANRDSIVLVSGTNEQYAMPLAVTLSSLLGNLKSGLPVRIFILNTNLSADAKHRLTRAIMLKRQKIELIFVSVNPDRLSAYSSSRHLTVESVLRLLVPELLPPDIERALYLDCDLCVLKDITPLWQLDETQFAACASIDPVVRVVSNESGLGNYRELGIPGDSPYFNAGILLMNLRTWREEQIGRATLEYLNLHECLFLDQDAINAVLAGRIGVLPMTWNANVSHLKYFSKWPEDDFKRAIAPEVRSLQRSPAICHFAGGFKPWLPGFQLPFLGTWIYYLWRSRWFSLWEVMLWTAKWSAMHLRNLLKRKVIVRFFRAKPAS